jgi:hypothetical protein
VADAIFAVKLVEVEVEKAEPVGLGGTRHADAGNYIRHLFACQDVNFGNWILGTPHRDGSPTGNMAATGAEMESSIL